MVKNTRNCRHIEPKTEFSIENCQEHRHDADAPQHHGDSAAKCGEGAFRENEGAGVRQNERIASAPAIPIDDPCVWREACPNLQDTGLPLSTLDEIGFAGGALAGELQLRPSERVQALAQLGPLLFGLLCAHVAQIVADARQARQPILRPGGLFVSVKRAILAGERDFALDVLALRRKHRWRQGARSAADASLGAQRPSGDATFRSQPSATDTSLTPRDRN